jgi:hypothetical protein
MPVRIQTFTLAACLILRVLARPKNFFSSFQNAFLGEASAKICANGYNAWQRP